MDAFAVSVIIPTKDRPRDLSTTIRTLLKQTILPAQVVVVDQSTSDEAMRLLEAEFVGTQGVRLDYVRDPSITGAATARNRAMELATGDIWLFLDDDVEMEPDFIERLLEVYRKHPEFGGISGIITNYSPLPAGFRLWDAIFARGPFHDERLPIYWKCEQLRDHEPIPVTKFTGALMSFRSSLIHNARFDLNLRGGAPGEDVDFCYRLPAGTLLVIAPSVRLVHNRSPYGRARDHWLRGHAQSSYYLYERNWSHGIKNRLCFAWLNLGYALMLGAICATRRSLDSWRALRAGRLVGKTYAHPERYASRAETMLPSSMT